MQPTDGDFKYGDVFSFTCETGYQPSDPTVPETQQLQCVVNPGYTQGRWEGNRVTCSRIQCGQLHAPAHGSMHCNDSNWYLSQCTIACGHGYILNGSPIRNCLRDKQWAGTEAFCEAIECGRIQPYPYQIMQPTDGDFKYGDVFSFTCETGYQPSDPTVPETQQLQCVVDPGSTHGRWEGTRVGCSRKACQVPVAPSNGYVSGVGHLYNDTMTFSCAVDLGYVLQGSPTTVCQADQTWSHGTPTCQLITCDQLDPSPNIATVPDTCTAESANFNENCVLFCKPGFTSTSGQTILVATCGASSVPGSTNGTWSESIDNFKCQDTTPPVIVCPSDITADNDPGLDSGQVNWTAPVASDTTGATPVVLGSVTTPHRFTIGVHTVNYTAIDGEGLTTSCGFQVEIRDITDPVCVSCPEDINEVSSNREFPISWEEPSCTDNSGDVVDVSGSHIPGSLFYWEAPQQVSYIARDDAGNMGFCNFTVTLEQHSCPYQAPPQNGAIACDMWLGGQFCSVSCNRDFDFAREPESLYYCKQEEGEGRWSPFFPSFQQFVFPWPDCTRKTTPGAVVGLQVQYYITDCAVDTEEIRQNFIEQAKMMNFLAQGFCMDEAECNIENVQVSCGTPAARGARRSTDNVINLDFDVVVALKESSSFNGSSVQSVTTQIDFLVLDIENTITHGGFNISVGNLTISTIPGSFNKITDTQLIELPSWNLCQRYIMSRLSTRVLPGDRSSNILSALSEQNDNLLSKGGVSCRM
ncbi:SVEP1 [Branchiostoma lanceolatum]|uniref:SVEP1 protein n=1 Tax=Branchiostoma lanceolatum TaxID=7740 RepID=A0A8S4MMP0_BRALA|nr:SVEP1 [Branchiostoma lanceolatum]